MPFKLFFLAPTVRELTAMISDTNAWINGAKTLFKNLKKPQIVFKYTQALFGTPTIT